MSARRPILAILVSLCVLACALVAGVAQAGAATQFGSYGTEAGQFREPWGIGVDQASGDVYVADPKNQEISEFEASGAFVRAWGGRGSVEGVAVDNDPLSSSYQDVYVFDPSNQEVEKFDSSGKFLLEFKIEQNFSDNGTVIAVGPSGRVYVGAKAEVQVYEPSGVLSESISLAGLSGTAPVTALAVDGSGDVFVKDQGVPGVREFEANGTEKATQFDAGSETVEDIAVDGSGDLFVSEASVLFSPATFRVFEYSPTGEELASFDNESTLGFREGIAYASVLGVGEIFVTNIAEGTADVSVVPVPVSGPPVIESNSVSAVGGRRGHATVKATLDAEGNPTTYRVEYVSDADFQDSGYADALSTPEVSLGAKFAEVPVSVELSELVPGGIYHYRIVASSPKGSESSLDQTVEAVPPALINGPWIASVASMSATFAAEVDPLGVSTEYRIEYGPTTAYGEVLTGILAEDEGYVPVRFHRQDLLPSTVYHYRLVVHNEIGEYATVDHSFVTQVAGGQGVGLPDGRVWELVSPANKKGALIAVKTSEEPYQAAASGSAIAYQASEPVGEDVIGRGGLDSVILSERGSDGWVSRDITAPNPYVSGEISQNANRANAGLLAFSPDLSVGLYEPEAQNDGGSPLSPEVTERTLYLRGEPSGAFLPLETRADVTSGAKFDDTQMHFMGGSPDMSHVVFETIKALTPEAVAAEGVGVPLAPNLYEWSRGKLQLVNIAPNGTSEPNAWLGDWELKSGSAAHAISNDGRWVVWTQGRLLGGGGNVIPVRLYVRDMVGEKTFRIGGDYPRFETMSSDGSKVFFIETASGRGGDLYVFDTATGTQTDLTADHGAGEPNAGVQDAVMGASEDGSYVYFVATGVLADGAVKGADNVYVLHESEGVWTTKYIATLSDEDSKSWRGHPNESPGPETNGPVRPELVSSRVSPDGRYLTFMSERSLTGYDNRDAVSGQPDEEVYLYDASTGHLACASCNPTGARPVGIFDDRESNEPLIADLRAAWSGAPGQGAYNHWLAGSVPGWVSNSLNLPSYQPRYLSDSGRLFFDSPDALVPQDTNGVEDAYEYEPAGVGNCTNASTTFSETSQGCVSLISAGHSGSESIFIDASENGNDVFFATNEKLVSEDYDTAYDIYDAHACSSEAPCRGEAVVSPPPCTSGDACKAAPSPQPEIFGPAPSATFSGIGNVEEAKTTVKRKAKAKPKPKHKSKVKKRSKRRKRKAKRAGVRSGRASGKGR
jgi:hypothetical protein